MAKLTGKFADHNGRVRSIALTISDDLAEDVDTLADFAELVSEARKVAHSRVIHDGGEFGKRRAKSTRNGADTLLLLPELAEVLQPAEKGSGAAV
jgi:hypothetical protein